MAIKLLLAQIVFLEEQIQTIEEAIQFALEDYRAECPCDRLPANCHHVIETVPDLGPVLTAAIIGEVGDIGRFANARKLVAYAGLDATTRESGQFVGTRNHLYKRGSPHLRRVGENEEPRRDTTTGCRGRGMKRWVARTADMVLTSR